MKLYPRWVEKHKRRNKPLVVWQQLALLILFSLKSRNIPQPSLCSPVSRGSKHRLSVFTFSFKYGISKCLNGEVIHTCIIFQVFTVSELDLAMRLLIKQFHTDICALWVSDIRICAYIFRISMISMRFHADMRSYKRIHFPNPHSVFAS